MKWPAILSRFLERRRQDLLDPSWGPALMASGGGPWAAPAGAENLATCFAAVQAISSAVASLPPYVYRRTEAGRVEDLAHPLNRLIRQGPNPDQTWPDFCEFLMASVLLRGNALAELLTDGRGAIIGLQPIPWGMVSVLRLRTGRVVYDVMQESGPVRRLLPEEVLHLKDRSDDGLVGRSRLSRAAGAVANASSVQAVASAIYANGIAVSGALQLEDKISIEQRNRLKQDLTEYAGVVNTAKFLVLDQGLKWQQISVSPEDAELLASRRFSTEELARIFQVPPPLVGIWDNSTFTNSETAGRWFATHTLTPWLRKIESEFSRSVFTANSSSFLEFDISGFLRGDPEARWKSYDVAIKNRVLTPNEVRQVEGWNPRPGGDEFPAAAASASIPADEPVRETVNV